MVKRSHRKPASSFEEARHFGGVSVPKQQPAQAAPKEDDPAVQQAVAEASRAKKAGRGYRATILTKDMMSNQGSGSQQLSQTLGS